MVLKAIHKEILLLLYYERRYMTIRELSTISKYSWQTIDKYVDHLYKKKFVEKKEYLTKKTKKKRIKVKFNFDYYNKLKKRYGFPKI